MRKIKQRLKISEKFHCAKVFERQAIQTIVSIA